MLNRRSSDGRTEFWTDNCRNEKIVLLLLMLLLLLLQKKVNACKTMTRRKHGIDLVATIQFTVTPKILHQRDTFLGMSRSEL